MTIQDLLYITHEEQKVVIETLFHIVLFDGCMYEVNHDLIKRKIYWLETRNDKMYIELCEEK